MSKNISVGRKVLFIGGPEAGNVRVVPESAGDHVQGESDYIYRIWPMSVPGNKAVAYFAYAANENPLNMYMDMWREYSPVAQIRRADPNIAQTYQKVSSVK